MRRLGKELGVEAMSLYRYVNGREDLLEGMVDHMVGRAAPGPRRRASRHRARAGRPTSSGWPTVCARSPGEHPNVFPLIATRHPAAPWLRPPLRSLRVVEDFLTVLISRGFSDTRAVMAYRAFSSFLLGHLLLEASMLGAQTSPAEEPLDEGESDVPNEDQELDLEVSRTSSGWKSSCPRTTPPRSSNKHWRTCWTASTDSSRDSVWIEAGFSQPGIIRRGGIWCSDGH